MKVTCVADICEWKARMLDRGVKENCLHIVLSDEELIALFKDMKHYLAHTPTAPQKWNLAWSKYQTDGRLSGILEFVHGAKLQGIKLHCARRCLDAA